MRASVHRIGFTHKLKTSICSVHWDADGMVLHDLFARRTCRCDQHCILAFGLIDAFVHAHNHHRHNRNDPGHLEDCMQGRIRLMTAVAPTYTHTFQTLCYNSRPGDILDNNFRLLAPKTKYRQLPTIRTTTRLTGIDFSGWSIFTDG